MTRKNLILLLFSLLTLNSCNKHEGPELRFCENYIQNYCQGDLVLLSRSLSFTFCVADDGLYQTNL